MELGEIAVGNIEVRDNALVNIILLICCCDEYEKKEKLR
jgi:hypothetical protein